MSGFFKPSVNDFAMEPPMSSDLLAGHLAVLAELVERGLRKLKVNREVIDRHDGIGLLLGHAIGSACKMG
jgi:hypothetical protein